MRGLKIKQQFMICQPRANKCRLDAINFNTGTHQASRARAPRGCRWTPAWHPRYQKFHLYDQKKYGITNFGFFSTQGETSIQMYNLWTSVPIRVGSDPRGSWVKQVTTLARVTRVTGQPFWPAWPATAWIFQALLQARSWKLKISCG